jgi:tetratricopeptide (TPR) repeat protein
MLAYTMQKSLILSLLFLCACGSSTCPFEPKIHLYPSCRAVDRLPSAFVEVPCHEEWERELFLGLQFAKEFDFYRAITCYKRAAFLAPSDKKIEIEYHLVEAYYLGGKYQDVIDVYESGHLGQAPLDFPALKELLLMLYDSYQLEGFFDKAYKIRCYIESLEPSQKEKFELYEAVIDADFCTLNELQSEDPDVNELLYSYVQSSKSPQKARMLNAILPGAGYYYVDQKKTAVTAFIVNALFTYAAYQFFDRGYVAAGLITTSLEMGWYFGGIQGAGLAANEWNQYAYEAKGKEFLLKKRLFPLLMFEYAF